MPTIEMVEENTLVLAAHQLGLGQKVIVYKSLVGWNGCPFVIKALQLPFVVGQALGGGGQVLLDTRQVEFMELSPEMISALEGKGEP